MEVGIKQFDSVLEDGFTKNKLNILGTEFAFGKTVMMCMVSVNALMEGKNVLFLTQEDSIERIVHHTYRVISENSKIDKDKVLEFRDRKDRGKITVKQVSFSVNPKDLIKIIRECEDIDLVIVDSVEIKYDKGTRTNMSDLVHINNNVEPILLFTKIVHRSIITPKDHMVVDSRSDVALDRCNIFTIEKESYEDGVKVGKLYYNREPKGSITLNFNTFTIS